MARIKITCKHCGNVFDWNDQWPAGLKKCPLCGILAPFNHQHTRLKKAS